MENIWKIWAKKETVFQRDKSYTAYSCFNLLAFQLFWEFKPFEKQLSSEKQIKPAIKLNLEFMKQNERESAYLNEEKILPKRLEQEKELNLSPIFIAPSSLQF